MKYMKIQLIVFNHKSCEFFKKLDGKNPKKIFTETENFEKNSTKWSEYDRRMDSDFMNHDKNLPV